MNQLPTESPQTGHTMPAVVEFFLTKRLPCAFLILFMLFSSILFDIVLGGVPIIGLVMVFIGSLLISTIPAVMALICFGGGLKYAIQVAAMTVFGLLILSSASMMLMLMFVLFFALPSLLVANKIQFKQHFNQAAWLLATTMFALIWVILWLNMDAGSLKGSVDIFFTEPFKLMLQSVPVGDASALAQVKQLQSNIVLVFPGVLIFSLWLLWWANILYARKVAVKYGFFDGDNTPMLSFALPKGSMYVLLVAGIAANMMSGNLQYIGINTLLILTCLFSVQGIAVVHTWLRSKAMLNTIVFMYVMLFFWAPIALLFIAVGLLDIWFNYRRNMLPTTGEK